MPAPRLFSLVAAAPALLRLAGATGGVSGALRQLQVPPENTVVFYPDAPDASCTPDQSCTGGNTIPPNRGICVEPSGGAKQCWDVCNTAHPPSAYGSGDQTQTAGISLMVDQVRQGQHTLVKCPGLTPSATCNQPGERCQLAGWETGRGMCVLDSTAPGGKACWDMCDESLDAATFGIGAPANTADTVEAVRSGDDNVSCPGGSWGWYLLIPLFFICCYALCGSAILAMTFRKSQMPAKREEIAMDEAFYAPVPPEPEPQYVQEQVIVEPAPAPVMVEEPLPAVPPLLVPEATPIVMAPMSSSMVTVTPSAYGGSVVAPSAYGGSMRVG